MEPVDFSGLDGVDFQFRCQYMAGLNFYDLQPLGIANASYKVPSIDGSGRYILIAFCQDLPAEMWCSPTQSSMAVLMLSE